MSFAFFVSKKKIVMTEKNSPRKNQSQLLLPVFCAQSAQKAPNKKTEPPISILLGLVFLSNSSIRDSS